MTQADSILEFRDRLIKLAQAALEEGDFFRAAQAARALELLRNWQTEGAVGALPKDIRAILKENEASADSSGQPTVALDKTDNAITDPHLARHQVAELIDEGLKALDTHDLHRSQACLEVALYLADGSRDHRLIEDALQRLGARRHFLLQNFLEQARSATADRVNRWEDVLALDPTNEEAKIALQVIARELEEAGFREELLELRRPLLSDVQDIREVETAWKRVRHLLESGSLINPELVQVAQDLFGRLDDLRNRVLAASMGGTSSERAQDFEKAIDIYRSALLQGYQVIIDDATGEPVETALVLRRVRDAYFRSLLSRVANRHADALESLQVGSPEDAVARLEEALGLLKKVEEGGEKERMQIEQLLEHSRSEVDAKLRARALVQQSQQIADYFQMHRQLLEARRLYPRYPEIDKLIEANEQLILRETSARVDSELARAEVLRRVNRYEQARSACDNALRLTHGVPIVDEKLTGLQNKIRELQDAIVQSEADWQRVQAKLSAIRVATDSENVHLARTLLEELTTAERQVPEVRILEATLELHEAALALWARTREAFYSRDLRQTMILARELIDRYPGFAERANEIAYQAKILLDQLTVLGNGLLHAESRLASQDFDEAWHVCESIAATDMAVFGLAASEIMDRAERLKQEIKHQEFDRIIRPRWYPIMDAVLHQNGRIALEDLPELPDRHRHNLLQAYLTERNQLDLEYDGTIGSVLYQNQQLFQTLRRTWHTWVERAAVDCRRSAEILAQICRITGLRPPEQLRSSASSPLCAFLVDISPLVEGLRVQPTLPTLMQSTPHLADDIRDIRQILGTKAGLSASLVLLVTPLDAKGLTEYQETIDRSFKRQHALDVVCIGQNGILDTLLSKYPGDELRKMLLRRVDLKKASPFTPDTPPPDDMFFGRELELRAITDHAGIESSAIIGGRRIGKTSILKRLQRVRLPAAGYRALYHDCIYTPTEREFVQGILGDRLWFPRPLRSTPGSLTEAIRKLPTDRPLIILLDEVDKLIGPDREAGYPIFRAFRALANSGCCQFVLSGERTLRGELKEPNSPLYNFATELLVGRLDMRSTEELVTKPMRALEIQLVDEAFIVERIWSFTSGHPGVVQRLCQSLMNRLSERDDHCLTIDDVEAIVSDPNFLRWSFLGTYWERATALERLCSLLLASDDRIRTLATAHEALTGLGLEVTLDQTDGALERLVDLRNILQRDAAGYWFAVSAFPAVLAKTHRLDDLIALCRETYLRYGDVQPIAEGAEKW